MQEMFPDENAHHIPSLPSNKIPYRTTTPQPSSLQAKAKKLMQKEKRNIRNFNFKKDPSNNHEGENKKKHQKDVGKPSSISSRRNRSPVVIVQDDTPAMQPLDQAYILIQKHSKPKWFPKKSGLAKRRMTWFDLFLKSNIDKDENHILGPLTVTIAKKFKELIKKDKLTIADFKGAGLEWLKVHDEEDVSKPRSFKRHMLKSTKPHPCFYNNDNTYLVDLRTEEKYTTSITKHYVAKYYKEGIEDKIPKRWSKEVCRYHFEALNDLRIKSFVRIVVKKKWGYGFLTSIVVRRSDDKEYEFSYADLPRLSVNNVEDMYLLQVQDKLHHLPLEFVKDFNNALLMFFRRIVIKNKWQQRLKGRDWTDYDVKSLRETLKKIDEILRYREQLRRLKEYAGGRPKTVNPRTFVKPL
ncbi:hypothetical protein Tco_1366590 [Tanacetum coccineum]